MVQQITMAMEAAVLFGMPWRFRAGSKWIPSKKGNQSWNCLRQRDMSRIKVLLYHDRNAFDRSRVILSPLYNAVNYFRTLNVFQLLSWFLWLVLLAMLRTMSGNTELKGNITCITIQVLALASSIFLLDKRYRSEFKSTKADRIQ